MYNIRMWRDTWCLERLHSLALYVVIRFESRVASFIPLMALYILYY